MSSACVGVCMIISFEIWTCDGSTCRRAEVTLVDVHAKRERVSFHRTQVQHFGRSSIVLVGIHAPA